MSKSKSKVRRNTVVGSLVAFCGLGVSVTLGGSTVPVATMAASPLLITQSILNPFTLTVVTVPVTKGVVATSGLAVNLTTATPVIVAPLVLPISPADVTSPSTTAPGKGGGTQTTGTKAVPPVVTVVSSAPPVPPASVFNP